MDQLAEDLAYLEAIASELKAYLLASELYWPLGSHLGQSLPQGTLGGALLRVHRLAELGGGAHAYHVAVQAFQDGLRQWQVQAEQKAAREVTARIHAWSQYLEELGSHPDRYAPDYSTQVMNRTVLHFLQQYLANHPSDGAENEIGALDERAALLTRDGNFVWNPAQAAAFPRADFPWLYVAPKLED